MWGPSTHLLPAWSRLPPGWRPRGRRWTALGAAAPLSQPWRHAWPPASLEAATHTARRVVVSMHTDARQAATGRTLLAAQLRGCETGGPLVGQQHLVLAAAAFLRAVLAGCICAPHAVNRRGGDTTWRLVWWRRVVCPVGRLPSRRRRPRRPLVVWHRRAAGGTQKGRHHPGRRSEHARGWPHGR